MSASSPLPPSTVVNVAASPVIESKPPTQSPEHIQSSTSSGAPALQKRSFMSRWFGSSAAESTSSNPNPGKILQLNSI